MNWDWKATKASKDALRRQHATLSYVEKLRMLDVLRERALVLREAGARYLATRGGQDSASVPADGEKQADL